MKRGSLVVVGSGMQLGRHISERCLSEIRHAAVVFLLTDEFATAWFEKLRPDAIALHKYYGDKKDRRITYREMEQAVLARVREGHAVCLVLYGHPGVFADVPHAAMRRARSEGYAARMEPGISADACLYADLGIDPGKHGVQCFETTQFLIYQRQVDPTALLILWQVALCGDLSCATFETRPRHLQLLVDKLARHYPLDTEVILYEAATLSIQPFRAEYMALRDLPHAKYKEFTTLVIPPAREMEHDEPMMAALKGA